MFGDKLGDVSPAQGRAQAVTCMMDNVSMLKILALREHAQQALGTQFELKQFHDEVLAHGALPLSALEQTIEQWLARTKGHP